MTFIAARLEFLICISLGWAAFLYTFQRIVTGGGALGRHSFFEAGGDSDTRLPAKLTLCPGAIKLYASERRFDAVNGKRGRAP